MRRQTAETLALRALGWLAGQEELLAAFLAATGATPADLRREVENPAFLIGVLDFLLAEDARVIAFCDAAGIDYQAPMQARAELPGGAPVHWT